mmetsp:Transcript_38834/g.86780  ORF Transcript_38834/g.86780 Transcript_38834/m.86780 type:complete len:247 (+) Transcript_38834:908-1648(+)
MHGRRPVLPERVPALILPHVVEGDGRLFHVPPTQRHLLFRDLCAPPFLAFLAFLGLLPLRLGIARRTSGFLGNTSGLGPPKGRRLECEPLPRLEPSSRRARRPARRPRLPARRPGQRPASSCRRASTRPPRINQTWPSPPPLLRSRRGRRRRRPLCSRPLWTSASAWCRRSSGPKRGTWSRWVWWPVWPRPSSSPPRCSFKGTTPCSSPPPRSSRACTSGSRQTWGPGSSKRSTSSSWWSTCRPPP